MQLADQDSIESAASIPLTNSERYVLVSEADYRLMSMFKWRANHNGYALTGHSDFMHRMLCPAGHGLVVDHINGNTLDNRRSNLRVATRAQNNTNRAKSAGCVSPYKGVTWMTTARHKRGYWKAAIGGKHLGYFDSEIDAALAYDKAAIEQYADFARLNFSLGVVSPLDRIYDRASPSG